MEARRLGKIKICRVQKMGHFAINKVLNNMKESIMLFS
jgi:hypothetical protein